MPNRNALTSSSITGLARNGFHPLVFMPIQNLYRVVVFWQSAVKMAARPADDGTTAQHPSGVKFVVAHLLRSVFQTVLLRRTCASSRKRHPARRLRFECLENRQLPAVLLVNSLADDSTPGDGLVTLREAIAAANLDQATDLGQTGSGTDTIEFAPGLSGQVELSLAQNSSALVIHTPITIRGNTNGITITRSSEAPTMRLFEVTAQGRLTLESLTLSGGLVRGANGSEAGQAGGEGLGGAVLNLGGTIELYATTLENNAAIGGQGGPGASGGRGRGGAIFSDGGSVLIVNTTISGNTAQSGVGTTSPSSFGGGVYTRNGTLSIYNSTLTNNTSSAGRQVYVLGEGTGATATLALHSSIAAQAGIVQGTDLVLAFDGGASAISSGTHNLVRFAVGFAGTYNTADPLLEPLTNNGGPTRTHALASGSPAMDHGANPLALATDGRGFPYVRTAGGATDIGAFELQSMTSPNLAGDYNRNEVVEAADYVLWRKTFGFLVDNYSGADGNGNGEIDLPDYAVWTANFGATTPMNAMATSAVSGTTLEATTTVTLFAAPADIVQATAQRYERGPLLNQALFSASEDAIGLRHRISPPAMPRTLETASHLRGPRTYTTPNTSSQALLNLLGTFWNADEAMTHEVSPTVLGACSRAPSIDDLGESHLLAEVWGVWHKPPTR